MPQANLTLIPKQDNKPETELDNTIARIGVAPHNLPAQPTPLIGREHEVISAVQLLRREDVRLLSFIGPGGVGKTRLALRAAEELLGDFADGVYFIGLAHITDAGLAVSTIAQALGVRETPGQPMLSLLKTYLRDRQVLLLLDNFEHVISAGPSITKLLVACPALKLMVTSRAVLHLRGEQEFLVSPLELPSIEKETPDVEELTKCAAVALFVQRAKSVKPDFQVTAANAQALAQICRRLDGLPLAIELVAARSKLLPPQAMLARLTGAAYASPLQMTGAQDLPARQQTMRATMEWSYDLLNPAEQRLLRRIAVFAGGCTLEAAEVVCDAGIRDRGLGIGDQGSKADSNELIPDPRSLIPLGVDVLNGSGSLVDKSLLRKLDDGQGHRLVMLETIREYALECLMSSEESAAVQKQHALFFLCLAEQSESELRGSGQVAWLEHLEAEHDNFRAALKWSLVAGDIDFGLRLASALGKFWGLRDHLSEGREWLSAMLSRPDACEPTAMRAKALTAAASLADNQGDYDSLRVYCTEALSINRKLENPAGISNLYVLMGKAASDQGDYAGARSMLEEGMATALEIGHKHLEAVTNNGLGEIARMQGDYDAANLHYDRCLAILRAMGNNQGIAFSLHNLAYVRLHQGRNEQARSMFEEGLAIFQELGNRLGIAMCAAGLGGVFGAQKQSTQAARLFGVADAQLEAVGARLDPADQAEYDRYANIARRSLGEAEFEAARTEGKVLTIDEALSGDDTRLATGKPEAHLPKQAASTLSPESGTSNILSTRELEVLRLVADGLTDPEVAARLSLSQHTVNAHLRSIYGKFGVTSRSAATRYAIEQNLM